MSNKLNGLDMLLALQVAANTGQARAVRNTAYRLMPLVGGKANKILLKMITKAKNPVAVIEKATDNYLESIGYSDSQMYPTSAVA